MNISRRGFITALAAAVVAGAADPERALWRPGQRSYFFLTEQVSLAEAQRRYNYMRSAQVEALRLAPATPWPGATPPALGRHHHDRESLRSKSGDARAVADRWRRRR